MRRNTLLIQSLLQQKEVNRHHLHLAEIQRQEGEWGNFMVQKRKGLDMLSLELVCLVKLEAGRPGIGRRNKN